VHPQKYPLHTQEKTFLNLILNNKKIAEILNRGFLEELPNWYLVAGCLNQTIWNQLTNKEIENEIKDYDIIYFDADISGDKEKDIQEKSKEHYSDLEINLDVINQARVHLWTEKDWGLKMRPLVSCEDAIASWPITVSCIGIRKEKDQYIIMAPYGLTDSLEMILRPNKTTVMREIDFNYKSNKWIKKWPELTRIPW
jgi:hypothetical protein